ncbi:MAG: hypothetical protein DMF68_19775 [Acidobacteria bacterium]|nr:MAG: hypothetical protein DMF68_19775 [Acidobacteriota bacterium]
MTLGRLGKWGWETAHRPIFYRLTAPLYHRVASPLYRAALSSKVYLKERLTDSLLLLLRRRDQGRVSQVLRRWIWRMNQAHRPAQRAKIELGRAFDAILARIATGAKVSSSELLPYLCLPGRTERSAVNSMLADAYLQRETAADLKQARVFIERAWLLSGFSKDLLPLYTKICAALKDAPAMREAYKRLGMAAAADGNIPEAIDYFNLSHYSDLGFQNLDRYEFDFDILNCMEELADAYRFPQRNQVTVEDGKKIRLAYLVKGATEPNSILVEINLVLAEHHDKSRFDITFFIPVPEQVIAISKQAQAYIRKFESLGCRVVTAPRTENQTEALVAVGKAIYDAQPHLMITSAALANFSQYFITCLRPAPVILGLVQGPPPQFAPPILDWAIAWTKHPLMDSPVNCSLVELKLDYPVESNVAAYSRRELDLPDEATVLMSAGRFPKFQDLEFWKAINALLSKHAETYYVAVGPREDQIPFLDAVIPREVRQRVRFLGWREDFLSILPTADIIIDTYPSGGGQVLVQGMSRAIPIVSKLASVAEKFTVIRPVRRRLSDSAKRFTEWCSNSFAVFLRSMNLRRDDGLTEKNSCPYGMDDSPAL